ncbi:unnamed protein product [Phyllotreta striolata]|uniref:Uncharacterized protein n=1 Tax=Phyllotreta striolata TaxID=444603 RepID=A0A9N9TQ60_PHYSR|nr:unnamed protein product [Phyllotreta striolata]
MNYIFVFTLFGVFLSVSTQNCKEYGEWCSDHKSCCGGCCLTGICKDTYADCRIHTDPCLFHSCPPDQECYIYEPKDCLGCGPTTQCRLSPPAPREYIISSTESIDMGTNSVVKRIFSPELLIIQLVVSFLVC